MKKVMKVIASQSGHIFYIRDCGADYHTQFGFLKKDDIAAAKDGEKILTNTGKEFSIFSPGFIDSYRRMRRAPQVIPLKDIGLIIAETGIGRESIVVDAGTGSGGVACFLANIAKKVTSYELRADFLAVAVENKEMLGLDNLEIKNRDVCQGIDESDVDVIIYDLPEPWLALPAAEKALKPGGYLISYSPTIPQVMELVAALPSQGFVQLKTVELIERPWETEKKKVRPKSTPMGHSGFLTFARKLSGK